MDKVQNKQRRYILKIYYLEFEVGNCSYEWENPFLNHDIMRSNMDKNFPGLGDNKVEENMFVKINLVKIIEKHPIYLESQRQTDRRSHIIYHFVCAYKP